MSNECLVRPAYGMDYAGMLECRKELETLSLPKGWNAGMLAAR